MRHWLLSIAFLVLASHALAQAPTTQPNSFDSSATAAMNRRLAEKQRAATTQPDAQLNDLKRQIVALRAENLRLRIDLAKAKSAQQYESTSSIDGSDADHRLPKNPYREDSVDRQMKRIEAAVDRHVMPEAQRQGDRIAKLTQEKVNARLRSDMTASEIERMIDEIAKEMEPEYDRAAKDLEPNFERAAKEAFPD